ncbi:HAD family hydrolase [Streptomyces sp. NPDC005202]|uniref:D-glycero-alpha-D-manno-heptose-1,7-bisphosphate 7-phosphatase n=1 Tax=Streptomyces sp. NPDC005202 TaxID=3157021 RepID=UPI00339FF6CA
MSPVKAVLFDRDGTLVEDVPYNGEPARVRPVNGAREAVQMLRARGIGTGVVTNQSGVARGLLSTADVRRVNERIDELLGPFDVWAVCPHGPDDGCHRRKPQPGMVLWAAGQMCTAPADIVVIGDIGADMEAARRAGAHGILVPTPQTRPKETAAAEHVARDPLTAVRAVLTGPPWGSVLADEGPIEAAYREGRVEAADGRRSAEAVHQQWSAGATDGRAAAVEASHATCRRPR